MSKKAILKIVIFLIAALVLIVGGFFWWKETSDVYRYNNPENFIIRDFQQRKIVENEKAGLRVETIEGFTDHSYQDQLISFIEHLKTKPKKIITNHGEPRRCVEMAKLYHKTFGCRTITPNNLETIRLR